MVNRIWPTARADKSDSVSSVSASACHIGGPNSVNPGQILLVYGMADRLCLKEKKVVTNSIRPKMGHVEKMSVLRLVFSSNEYGALLFCGDKKGNRH